MKDLLPLILQWSKENKPFVVARVVQTWGSSPRPVGSALLISASGEMAGSVSGGCVEGAVLKEALGIMGKGSGKLLSYGVADEDAWAVGLSCGGSISIFLESYPQRGQEKMEVWNSLDEWTRSGRSCALVTPLNDSRQGSALVDKTTIVNNAGISDSIIEKTRQALALGRHEIVQEGDDRFFIQVFSKKKLLLIIGVAHVTASLVALAKEYDFETVVIDPRGVFVKNQQFNVPPDRIIENYPSETFHEFTLDGNTFAVVLSHDPKIDDDALTVLLKSEVAYIGALGSKKTHEKRTARLLKAGFGQEAIARIESPVGIDIGAQGANEIALSIMGSLIRVKNKLA